MIRAIIGAPDTPRHWCQSDASTSPIPAASAEQSAEHRQKCRLPRRAYTCRLIHVTTASIVRAHHAPQCLPL